MKRLITILTMAMALTGATAEAEANPLADGPEPSWIHLDAGTSSPSAAAENEPAKTAEAPDSAESSATAVPSVPTATGTTEQPGAEADPVALGVALVKDIREGNWRTVAAGLLSLLMLGLMRYRDKIRWFGTDRGAAVLLMILSLGGGLSTSLATDLPIGLPLFVSVVGTAWMAAGGYHWVRSVIWPKDKA